MAKFFFVSVELAREPISAFVPVIPKISWLLIGTYFICFSNFSKVSTLSINKSPSISIRNSEKSSNNFRVLLGRLEATEF